MGEEAKEHSKEKEITIEIRRPEIFVVLGILVAFFVLELIVTLNSPIAFGDEGFHVRVSQYIAENKDYPKWNPIEATKLSKFNYSRPPFWNLLLAGLFTIFGFSEFLIKFLTPFIAVVLTGLGTYLLVKNIYSKEVGLIATIILITIPSFVTYSVLFYTDALLVFYFSLFLFTLMIAFKTDSKKYWLLAGVFGALAFLTKTPGTAAFPLIALTFLYKVYREKNIIGPLKKYLVLFIPMMLIISGLFIRNLIDYNALSCEIPILNRGSICTDTFEYKNVYSFEGQAEQGGTGLTVANFGILNYITFVYGNVLFVFFALLAGFVVILMRKNLNDALIIIIILSFLPVFYLGSQGRSEDTARFTLGIAPVVALIAANYFERIYDFIAGYYKFIALVVIVFVLVFSYFNLKEKLDTMQQVKQFSSSFFEACSFIKYNTTKDALIATIWDHQTVYNCQRNAVGFAALPDQADIELSGKVDEVVPKLKAHDITHIFIQKFSLSQKDFQDKYPASFVRFLNDNPNNFKKIFENGIDIESCINQGGCDGSIVYEIL